MYSNVSNFTKNLPYTVWGNPGIMEGQVKEISLEKITSAMKKMKLEEASELLEESMEVINASGKVGIDVMRKLCKRVLDGKGMQEDSKTCVMVPIYKGKGNVKDCGAYSIKE